MISSNVCFENLKIPPTCPRYVNKHNCGVDSRINLIFLFCCFSEVIDILHKHLHPEYHYVLLSVKKKS